MDADAGKMSQSFRLSLSGGTSLTTAAVLALAVFFNPVSGEAAGGRYAPVTGSDNLKSAQVQEESQSSVPTFEQRAGAGLLDMMSEAERNAVPAIKWKELLPTIISQGQYDLIPKKIEAQVSIAFYYRAPFSIKDGKIVFNLVEGLISTGQFRHARKELRDSVGAEMLTRADGSGHTFMVDIFRNGEWRHLSEGTRKALEGNVGLWLKPMALYPAEANGAKPELMPLVSIALRYGSYDDIPASVTAKMAAHPQWNQIKEQFLRTAAEKIQLHRVTPAMWSTYDSTSLTTRYAGSNVLDLSSQMGQAHLIPGKLWTAAGAEPFTTPHPRLNVTPLYFIARAAASAQNLGSEQKAVLHRIAKDDWLTDIDEGFSPLYWAVLNKADGIVGDKVWSGLTREDALKYKDDGGYSLADLLANAGQADKIKHLLKPEEIAALPQPGSIAANPSSWTEVQALEQELRRGVVDKEKWLVRNIATGRTRLHELFHNIPTEETAREILKYFSLNDLMIEAANGDFALMAVADAGLLRCVPKETWREVSRHPQVLVEQGPAGKFILNTAAKDKLKPQMQDIPRDIRAALPREYYFKRDDLGWFPFFGAHFLGHESELPFETGKFRAADMLVIARGKGDSLMHVAMREQGMKYSGKLREGEVGPIGMMLERFPYDKWRLAEADGESALLKLARNGGLHNMPKAGFIDRMTAADLGLGGKYGDTVLYWAAGDVYSELEGKQVVWRNTLLDLIDMKILSEADPSLWTQRVRAAESDDFEINDNTRHALEKGDFPLLGLISRGYLPSASYAWTADAYTVQDSYGNDVARELYRQKKFTPDRVHDLARLGLLDKNKIPPYVIVDISSRLKTDAERAQTWLYTPAGGLTSIFAAAANHGQAEAFDWGDPRQSVRHAIPVEAWYKKGADGKTPVAEMIRHGKMHEIPADYLYDSPQMWTPELLAEVFDPANWSAGGANNMQHLWEQQTRFIEDELQGAAKDAGYREMLKSRNEMYKAFAPQFEKNYETAMKSSAPAALKPD